MLNLLFHDYKDYRDFKYWQSDPMEALKSSASPQSRPNADRKTGDRQKTTDLKPFYKNIVKTHLIKEIFSTILPKSRFDEKFSRVALVALMTEIVMYRDNFKQLLAEIVKIVRKELPQYNFRVFEESIASESEIDFKLVLAVHQMVQEMLAKTAPLRKELKEDQKENKKRSDRHQGSYIFVTTYDNMLIFMNLL